MKQFVYTIYDAKAEFGDGLFLFRRPEEAQRAFVDMARAQDNNRIAQHPEDYALVEIGTWMADTMLFERHEVPKNIMTGFDALSSRDLEKEFARNKENE